MVDKPVFPRPASAVAKYLDMQERDQEFMRYLSTGVSTYVRFINQERTTSGAERWDPTYCWICGGPCFLLAAWRRDNKPYENGNVIEGEVVHSHTQKELIS